MTGRRGVRFARRQKAGSEDHSAHDECGDFRAMRFMLR